MYKAFIGLVIVLGINSLIFANGKAGYREVYLGMTMAQTETAVKNDKFFSSYKLDQNKNENWEGTASCKVFDREGTAIFKFNKDSLLYSVVVSIDLSHAGPDEKKKIVNELVNSNINKFGRAAMIKLAGEDWYSWGIEIVNEIIVSDSYVLVSVTNAKVERGEK